MLQVILTKLRCGDCTKFQHGTNRNAAVSTGTHVWVRGSVKNLELMPAAPHKI
jgi:hypothetical protein